MGMRSALNISAQAHSALFARRRTGVASRHPADRHPTPLSETSIGRTMRRLPYRPPSEKAFVVVSAVLAEVRVRRVRSWWWTGTKCVRVLQAYVREADRSGRHRSSVEEIAAPSGAQRFKV